MSRRGTKKDEDKRVLANRYVVEKRLGSGNFGTAFLVKDEKANGELKVLKEISVGDLAPDETVDAMHEARLLSKLDNPGIVKFHDSFLDGEYFCIICEYCEGGDLDQKISSYKKQGKRFEEQQMVEWTIQLLLAVQHMHSRRVLHRDLKTRNIFLKNNRIKIGDFGISRILMGTVDMASTFTGTPYYMSPEVLKHEGYNSKSDIWSVGCILYEMAALQHAFEGQSLMGVMYKIVEGECPSLPEQYSADLGQFLKSLLTKDPEKRPSAGDALKMPFIARHLEKFHDGLVDKRNMKPDSTVIATREAKELAKELKKKSYLKDLQSEEEDKYKNMTPSERMRIRKMEKADKKAQELKKAAAVNYMANQTRQQTILDMKYKTTNTIGATSHRTNQRTARPLQSSVRPVQSSNIPAQSRSNQSTPSPRQHADPDDHWYDDDEGTILQPVAVYEVSKSHVPANQSDYSDDDDVIIAGSGRLTNQKGTLKARDDHMMKSDDSGVASRDASLNDVTLRAATNYDDRPITPMKSTVFYKEDHSSLDFGEDGIPDDADLAETYYQQYNEFDEAGAGASDEGAALESDEEQDLIDNMEMVLAQDAGIRTQTFNDDKTNAAFGPQAKEEKVRNMRLKCRQQLGDDVFNKVYKHILNFRQRTKNGEQIDDGVMMKGLQHLVPKPADAFLVDQLVFIEMENWG